MSTHEDNLNMCCGTTCDKWQTAAYVHQLQETVKGGLKGALLNDPRPVAEALADLAAFCMEQQEDSPLYVNGIEFGAMLHRNLSNGSSAEVQ